MSAAVLDFERDGAQLHARAAMDLIDELRAMADSLPQRAAGLRLHGIDALSRMLTPSSTIGTIAASHIGAQARPVRAILFDKSVTNNWALGWHQDRTIAVRERIDVANFQHWNVKAGMIHVEPPFDLLSRMVTLRLHLDDVPDDNAPLRIVPGSHRLGRIAEGDMGDVVNRLGQTRCLAETGDIWAYSTPIVHGSGAAQRPTRRRVLQIDFSADPLPGGLVWLGV